jgi:protein-S-isoprenylcysteine O-methyltransferase Ste14
MAWIATGGLAGYAIAVAVVRGVLVRRHGAQRFVVVNPHRMTRGEWIGGGLGLVGGAAVAAGSVAAALAPGPRLWAARPWGAIGAALLASGVALMGWAQLEMGPSWRVGVDAAERTGLVTAGPYRRIRNPIYTAMSLVAAGAALLTASPWVAAGFATVVAFAEWQVRAVEEPYLAREHGEEYARWAAGTGRFTPGVR